MKKITLLVFVFCSLFSFFSSQQCYGQTPDWVWARSAQGRGSTTCDDEGWSIATDISNNVYITGSYQDTYPDTIIFGSFILTTNALANFYLAKYDASGNIKWAKSAVTSSNGGSLAQNVCTDGFGNVYATGYFKDTVSFGSYTLTGVSDWDIFLVKYDSSGNVLWAKSAAGTSDDYGFGVSADRSGNVYITGSNSPSITFGSYTFPNAGVFLVKYDFAGNVLWATSVSGARGYSISTDAWANVYVTGYFASTSITFGSYTLTNAGNSDIFLAKYDSSGNVLWAKSAGGTNLDEGYYVAADSSGNAYITGYYYSSSITFGSYTLVNAGYHDAFLAKYDSTGNVRWAKSIGGTGSDNGYCVTIDKSNKIYITGGSYLSSSPSLTFDTITLLLQGTDPMFIAGYDSSGHVLWAKALDSGGDDNNAIAASPSGCIYIGGDFDGISPFILGNDSLVLSGGENVFVAKLCYTQIEEHIPEITTNKEFIIYPNPFDNKFTVATKSNEEYEITLFDVTSRELLRRSFVNQATINTEQLAGGIYIYEVRDKDGVGARGKLVKE